MDLTIDFEAIFEGEADSSFETLNLSNEKVQFAIIVGFGNGIYEEIRVTGHSKEAVFYFVRLIQRGGYQQDAAKNIRNKKLYRKEDACFPAEDPFIFLAPVTTTGECIDFAAFESEIQTRTAERKIAIESVEVVHASTDTEVEIEPIKKWWRFW